jgi:hypothetical protein
MVAASSPPRAQRICTLVWVSGWVGVRVCVGEGGGGSRYLRCVPGGVATVISLGIRSSLGFRFRIRFRVGIRCRTPDMCHESVEDTKLSTNKQHTLSPRVLRPRARACARSSAQGWCVDPGRETGGISVSPFSGCSDL